MRVWSTSPILVNQRQGSVPHKISIDVRQGKQPPMRQMRNRFFATQSKPRFIPPPIPLLKEMTTLAREHAFPSLKNHAVIGIQHLLPTTATLFDTLIDDLGVAPPNMFFMGKFYSTVPDVEDYLQSRGMQLKSSKTPKKPGAYQEETHECLKILWSQLEEHTKKQGIENLIILDEGGHCIDTMPKHLRYKYRIASIEQTRFGLYDKAVYPPFPLIDVARSWTKRKYESPLIATAVVRRFLAIQESLSLKKETVFGVVGNGAIGDAVTRAILARNHAVLLYDQNEEAFRGINHRHCYRVASIKHLISDADVILGCTGRDITKGIDVFKLVKDQAIFMSCSSQDIEFSKLLKQIAKHGYSYNINHNVSQLRYRGARGQELVILEHGFPINFDRTVASDPVEDMTLTRGLLLGAFLQAVLQAEKPIDDGRTINKSDAYALDPFIQQFVVNRWQRTQISNGKQIAETASSAENLEWFKKNSPGQFLPDTVFRYFGDALTIERSNSFSI